MLAMGWLGAGTRRGTGRRSGGDRKRTAGCPTDWRTEGVRGEIAGVKSLKRAFRFFPEFTVCIEKGAEAPYRLALSSIVIIKNTVLSWRVAATLLAEGSQKVIGLFHINLYAMLCSSGDKIFRCN